MQQDMYERIRDCALNVRETHPDSSFEEMSGMMRDIQLLREMLIDCMFVNDIKDLLYELDIRTYQVWTLELILERIAVNHGSDAWISAQVIECELDDLYERSKGETSKRAYQISRDFAHELASILY